MPLKPSLPKGTRDLLPAEMRRREYILKTVRQVFERHGFQPIETPAMEKLETLTGKYGEEGDRLIFKILDNGDFLKSRKEKIYSGRKSSILAEMLEEFFLKILRGYVGGKKMTEVWESPEVFSKSRLFTQSQIDSIHTFLKEYQPLFESYHSIFNNRENAKDKDLYELLREVKIDKSRFFEFLEKNIQKTDFFETDSQSIQNEISGKALRYDLTVPFARFVVQNQNELNFPFKRFQIQPVWRADRPQKGRFREFWQCDADAVGSDSLLLELEFLRIYDLVFKALGIEVAIHLNNRKLLAGLAKSLGIAERLGEFTIILDKLDKIGEEGILKELEKNNFDKKVGERLFAILNNEEDNFGRLKILENELKNSEIGGKGLEEIRFVLENLDALDLQNDVRLDISLARGLDYYTGAIFEIKAKNAEMGSLGGGGRYDDLTEMFGMKNLSGIGISFGLERILLVMEELGLFPDFQKDGTVVMFVNFGEKEALYSLKLANQLRDLGVNAEVYPDAAKMKKQLDFANKKDVPYVVLIGEREMENEQFSMKEMATGEQKEWSRIELLEFFSNQNPPHYGRH